MSEKQGLTVIVKTITRAILAVIFVYGFYIILHGHLSPGGGFGGGSSWPWASSASCLPTGDPPSKNG